MKVLVLAGGDSNERAVSLDSGAAVCQALGRLGHQVRAIDPAGGRRLVDVNGGPALPAATSAEVAVKSESESLCRLTQALDTDDIDVVFIALHGGAGENGSIQNLLELAGKKYTGSGLTASAVAMNKALTKRIMASLDIATPKWELYRVKDDGGMDRCAKEIADEFGLPLIVKPNDGGSTIGLTKVDKAGGIIEALRVAAEQSDEILVEAYIAGRELTVAVFDGQTYPLVEIKPVGGLYDYEAKYSKGKSEYVAPAVVEKSLAGAMQQAAVRVYDALGCTGLARVDFMLDERGRYFCLELNTLPGMTALSLAPMALGCEGIDFDRLISMIIDSAMRK